MSSIQDPLSPVLEVSTPVSEDWCHTKLEVKTFKYIWTIHHFSCRSETNGKFVESSVFPVGAANDTPKWSVRAYPRGRFENYKEYLALDIVAHTESKVGAKIKFSLLNDRREKFKSVESRTCFFTHGECSYFKDFVTRSTLLNESYGLLPKDTLTVLCEVSVVNESVNISGQSNIVQFKVPDNNLSEDLGTLFYNEQFSDVKLDANGTIFKAHKAILAARSKVFAAMFQHKMKEHNLNRVSITDVNAEVLEEMLRYMYTDKAPNLNLMAEELLAAADKYELKNLKVMCEESMQSNITTEKAAETLILADRHNAEELKSHTINFIISNATCVMETQGWKDMIKTHSHLIADAFCAIASKQLLPTEPPCKKSRN